MAFIIGLVIHEFGHGIQARAHGMRVRSFGLLMLGPLPLGAFAEPQGEELMKAPNRERLRLFAAGPSTNLFACIICLLMLGGLAGQFIASQPGLHAQGIVEESGAADGGLNAFDTIVAIDNQSVTSLADFDAVMSSHSAGDVVTIDIVRHDSGQSQQLVVNLSDKYQHYLDSGYDEETMKLYDIEPGDPFVGVVGLASNTYAVDNLAGPLSPNLDLDLKTKAIASPFHVIGLLITPFEFKGNAMHPIQEGMLAAGDGWFAQTVGLDGLLFLVNLAFWLLWVNFLLGMTNLIPIIPFDGGHMMRDTLRDILKVIDRFGRRFNKWKIHPLRQEHIVMKTSSKSSLFLFLMVAIIIIIPYF
jgi:membrane-associated protease RseP (regulator of RpoE activity)